MDYAVKLSRLPAELSIPATLQDRFRYEQSRGELVFRGFMTKCTYDELSALSDDADYHRALERLFVLTSAAAAPPSSRRMPATAIAAVIGALAIAAGALWVSTRQAQTDKPGPQPEVVVATAAAQ